MKEATIIHLYEGYPEYCWYPRTKQELEKLGFMVHVPQMPDPDNPRQDLWVARLKETIRNPDTGVYLIGHSIGAVTILRYLEELPENKKTGGAVLVAGFTDDMGYEVFSNFFTRTLDFGRIRNKADHFTVIVSDDDPYIDMKYGYELSEKLNGELIVKRNMKHMSAGFDNLPDVAIAIKGQMERKV